MIDGAQLRGGVYNLYQYNDQQALTVFGSLQDLLSFTIPAYTVKEGDLLVSQFVTTASNTSTSRYIRLSIGGAIISGSSGNLITQAFTRWQHELIVRPAGVSVAPGANIALGAAASSVGVTTHSIDFTQDQPVVVSGFVNTATTQPVLRLEHFSLRAHKAP
jgi:hypothetical protein